MNHDTKALLLECGAGVQMALGAIDDVLGQTRDKALEQALLTCRETHRALEKQTKTLLAAEHIPEKSANAMARGMSWLKTSTKLAVSPADRLSQISSPTAATWASNPSSATATAIRTPAKRQEALPDSSSTPSSFFASPCSRTCNLHDFLALVQKIFDCDFPPRGV